MADTQTLWKHVKDLSLYLVGLYIDTPTGNAVDAAQGPQGTRESPFSVQPLLQTQQGAEGGPPPAGRGFLDIH